MQRVIWDAADLLTHSPRIAAEAKRHALAEYPKQSVGYVTKVQGGCSPGYTYLPLENASTTPEQGFRVEGLDTIPMHAIVHSRTHEASTSPGLFDMSLQQEQEIPWAILYCNGHVCSDLQWFGDQLPIPPLVGRKFVSGYTDCWCLVRDVYRAQFGILLENVPRDEGWCLGDEPFDHFSPENIERTGFKIISRDDARPGDVLLGSIKSKVNNHCALLLENGYVLQQFAGKAYRSRRESIAQWQRLVAHVGRHKSFVDNPESIPKIVITET